jgi:hypothetical protein
MQDALVPKLAAQISATDCAAARPVCELRLNRIGIEAAGFN